MKDNKPNNSTNPKQQIDKTENIEELQKQVGAATSGDSITQDIAKLKKFTKKIKETIGPKVKPHAEKVKPHAQRVAAQPKKAIAKTDEVSVKVAQKVGFSWFKYVVWFVILFIVVFIVGFILKGISSSSNGENNDVTPTPTSTSMGETPTPIVPFNPANASVYATDSSVLKIEETNNILRNEMFTTSLSEPALYPPSLDFNIDFGKKK